MLLQLTSGRGPGECELAVGLFLAAIEREFSVTVLAQEAGRYRGALKSAVVKLETGQAEPALCGTVLWICKSPYRVKAKRKNWFIGVNRLEEDAGAAYDAGTPGVVFQFFKSGGKGGQHVNKTESAVRAIHVATGLTAVSSDERSQIQNKKLAYKRLKERLESAQADERMLEKGQINHNHNLLERGNPVRIYEGTVFKRVK